MKTEKEVEDMLNLLYKQRELAKPETWEYSVLDARMSALEWVLGELEELGEPGV